MVTGATSRSNAWVKPTTRFCVCTAMNQASLLSDDCAICGCLRSLAALRMISRQMSFNGLQPCCAQLRSTTSRSKCPPQHL